MDFKLKRTILFVVVFLLSAQMAFAFGGGKRSLEAVEELFMQGEYTKLYKAYLDDIQEFDPKSEIDETIFYYFILTCLELKQYDEAEGYLYELKMKSQILNRPDKLEFIWAGVRENRGNIYDAYQHYNVIRHLYPDSPFSSIVLYKLGKLAQKLGRFESGTDYFVKLKMKFPDSPEVIQLYETDDFGLANYFLVLGYYTNLEGAEAEIKKLIKKKIYAKVFRTYANDQKIFLVAYGNYPDQKTAEQALKKFMDKGMQAWIYPSYKHAGQDFVPFDEVITITYQDSDEPSVIGRRSRYIRNARSEARTTISPAKKIKTRNATLNGKKADAVLGYTQDIQF